MSFKEISDKLLEADRNAVDDWENRFPYHCRPTLEDDISFIEYRRSMLELAVILILDIN